MPLWFKEKGHFISVLLGLYYGDLIVVFLFSVRLNQYIVTDYILKIAETGGVIVLITSLC